MRELLKNVAEPSALLNFSTQELAAAVLNAMRGRRSDPIAGTMNRDSPSADFFRPGDSTSLTPMQVKTLCRTLDKTIGKAFELLLKQELIEADEGMNGTNGFVVLTELGARCDLNVDFRAIQQRGLLHAEMLHPHLREDVYQAFKEGRLGDSVFSAFKRIEIDVRAAAMRAENEYGADLMRVAFNPENGPLTDMSEVKSARSALASLFIGALGRFRNPESHTVRQFEDPIEAMQELMVASRLLRIVEQRSASTSLSN